MSLSFLTLTEFKLLTIMPSADVDRVEVDTPGFVDAQLAFHSAKIASRLRKRYADLVAPYPDVVRGWLATIVTPIVYRKRGANPSDPTLAELAEDRKTAEAEMKEAADSTEGLFDLPLRQNTNTTGIAKGAPLSYSEQSPYAWTTNQARTGREEDSR